MERNYEVGIWPGYGYYLETVQVTAFSEEQALEMAVAYFEKKGHYGIFFDDLFNEPDWEDNPDIIYVDATMEGANEPHLISAENLRIIEL